MRTSELFVANKKLKIYRKLWSVRTELRQYGQGGKKVNFL